MQPKFQRRYLMNSAAVAPLWGALSWAMRSGQSSEA